MNRNTLIALLSVPFLQPEGARVVQEAPRSPEVVEHTVQVVREEVRQRAVTHSEPEPVHMSDDMRRKLLEQRKLKNTEEGFKKTAHILQIYLKKNGFPFTCKTNNEDENSVGLSFHVDDSHAYYLSLPEVTEIDPESEYNVLFEEYEQTDGEWYPLDHEIVKSMTLPLLEQRIFELIGGGLPEKAESVSSSDEDSDY